MRVPLKKLVALGAILALGAVAACASDSPTAPQASTTAPALAKMPSPTMLPSGERMLGNAAVEPAYDDVTGNIIYLLTPIKAPLPSKANSHAVAPLYLVEYPAGSTVGTLNCMGVPGNCPDHDEAVASVATSVMPGVYGTDPTMVLGHDHLVAPPASGGDFNVAWEVIEILFTNTAAANTHLTTEAQVEAAIASGDAIEIDLGFAFNCSVVSPATYWKGTPVS